ncbi:pentatricopeptide repeat-containing protein [Prunus yedoensis var. nudiflora]|uniref:Pentatricopeptide repeat-containing protein n=1 Tax=Prunus yedoensis var. nudiflora TaxID=2094558 RepID=A0A314UGJ0_PRUYE|nr:pentatricopeptide repeat-containing protein [Prunus yedoensis var. nudiflora]
MPVEADASVWRALLNACRLHSATNLAGTIFEKLVELEPMNAGNYVLISNLYAAVGLWMEVREIRTRLREKGLERPPGIPSDLPELATEARRILEAAAGATAFQ